MVMTAEYEILRRDQRGLLLRDPLLGVSINGGDMYPVHEILDQAWMLFSKQSASNVMQTAENMERFKKWLHSSKIENALS